ncbi:MAG: hypothetical protein GKR93_07290 [Gammaproteobacteria bacterium]|nr:hypothetical protein [Gammaproteobacteria bacterium]
MKLIFTIILLCFSITACLAAKPITSEVDGFVFWKSETIDAASERLYKKLGDKRLVYEVIGNYQGHSMYLVLRGKTSSPELHETESDFQISIRGKATLQMGGELINPVKHPRKQQRGDAIHGADIYQLSAGDIIHVPPATPHLLVIDPDEPYLYLLIKIDEEPLLK